MGATPISTGRQGVMLLRKGEFLFSFLRYIPKALENKKATQRCS
jgi:hypothetical protein